MLSEPGRNHQQQLTHVVHRESGDRDQHDGLAVPSQEVWVACEVRHVDFVAHMFWVVLDIEEGDEEGDEEEQGSGISRH